MTEPRWVVFGAGGMLGTDLVETLTERGFDVLAVRHTDADITDPASITPHIAAGDIVVNAAAYTRVDDAETDRGAAFALNADGPANLARACAAVGARLVHYSTDYVFGDAPTGTPVHADAPYSPRCVYGESKALGEQHVRAILDGDALIARVAWLYGAHGRNFVHTIRGRLEAGAPLRVVNDQWGQPTWTRDVTQATIALAVNGAGGTHHLTNNGQCTWYEFACAIAEDTGHDPATITPVPSSEYPTTASRPRWSVLQADSQAPMRHWRTALTDYLG